jgi:hypothetical protein
MGSVVEPQVGNLIRRDNQREGRKDENGSISNSANAPIAPIAPTGLS